jgi:hypothetical protein
MLDCVKFAQQRTGEVRSASRNRRFSGGDVGRRINHAPNPGTPVGVATSCRANAEEAVAELRFQLESGDFSQIIVFYSPSYSVDELAENLSSAFPGTPICGCSTAGEITPTGFAENSLLAVAFPQTAFKAVSGVIEHVADIGFEQVFQASLTLHAKLAVEGSNRKDRCFGLMFADGLSNCEERIIAAVRSAIHDFPIVGGSAGDGLDFQRTTLIFGGRVYQNAAVIIFLETNLPFRVFRTQNFKATSTKLVVTAADVENRVVYELNAEPAALEYGTAIGLHPDALTPLSFASHPVVVKVGHDYYCRSIRNVNQDGSLTFFCAIDEGLVLTVAEPQDIVGSTREALESVKGELGDSLTILGFECILRRLDAETSQVRHKMQQLYLDFNVIGFHTYGEQFNAMHINQTLTGIAISAIAKT